jgi:hypothetical protein
MSQLEYLRLRIVLYSANSVKLVQIRLGRNACMYTRGYTLLVTEVFQSFMRVSPPILNLLGMSHRSTLQRGGPGIHCALYEVATVIVTKNCLRNVENLSFTGRKTFVCLGTEEIFVLFLVNLVSRKPLKAF